MAGYEVKEVKHICGRVDDWGGWRQCLVKVTRFRQASLVYELWRERYLRLYPMKVQRDEEV
ncbi:hypothetical protein Drorol1_Dr00025334, partial [Drosera rotundifolia]